MKYKLTFLKSAIKELGKLDFVAQKMIKRKLELLAQDPAQFQNDIKALKGTFRGKYRLRVRNYRIVYQRKDEELIILVVRVGHRKDVYLDK